MEKRNGAVESFVPYSGSDSCSFWQDSWTDPNGTKISRNHAVEGADYPATRRTKTVAGKPEASKIVACSPVCPTAAIPHLLLGGRARNERHHRNIIPTRLHPVSGCQHRGSTNDIELNHKPLPSLQDAIPFCRWTGGLARSSLETPATG